MLCQSINYCASNPCQNGGSCVNGHRTHLCFCAENFAGQFCELSIDDIEDHCDDNDDNNSNNDGDNDNDNDDDDDNNDDDDNDNDDDDDDDDNDNDDNDDDNDDDDDDDDDDDNYDNNNNTDNRICSSFSVIRMDNGDRVNTPLSSVKYCSSIRAYCPDGHCSYCQCEFRLTYRRDLQRCDDYYNG